MREKIIDFIRNSKFKTSPKIKKDFCDFLDWYKEKVKLEPTLTDKSSKEVMDMYLKERDIAMHGNITILEGANSRNEALEVMAAIGAAFLGFLLAIYLISRFL